MDLHFAASCIHTLTHINATFLLTLLRSFCDKNADKKSIDDVEERWFIEDDHGFQSSRHPVLKWFMCINKRYQHVFFLHYYAFTQNFVSNVRRVSL